MKTATLALGMMALGLGIASCIVDSSWLGLVGRWQDVEALGMEMEFTSGGRFNEYFLGELVGSGEFVAEGKTITLHYPPPCGGENQLRCDVRLGFTVTEDTLIITDSEGDFRFKRVDGSQ